MGHDWIDYILADATVVPEEHFKFFSEKVIWLPHSYQVNDALRRISERTPTRSECTLPERGFVFCCFNRTYKITPEVFEIWMSLLKAIDSSVLWLSGESSDSMTNLAQEARKRGVSADRLVFARKMPLLADHLARLRCADLFLDTLPYNAHTTASDALWAGVPVLTCVGSTFAGRVGASLLKAVGLDELITNSPEDYEALALELAKNPSLLVSIKNKLARHRDRYPLFNTERFARHIEAAYEEMWRLYRSNQAPRAFAVTAPNEPPVQFSQCSA
jgi:predicted O-linked N-acetylglucosamine transferase (SPINDLY family)